MHSADAFCKKLYVVSIDCVYVNKTQEMNPPVNSDDHLELKGRSK